MTVNPEKFVKTMRSLWLERGMKSGKPLEAAWMQMATSLNDCIEGKIFEDSETDWVFYGEERGDSQWTILRLPTGTGKTQGLAVYCSLLAKQKSHPGVLIITKFTDEIDELVNAINKKSGITTAYADYSKMKERLSSEELRAVPTLVITHKMYQMALDAESQEDMGSSWWNKYTQWSKGARKLIVIDETLDVIEPINLSLDTMRMIRAWIPRWIEREHPEKVETLDQIIAKFYEWEKDHPNEFDKEEIKPDEWSGINPNNLIWLRDKLCSLPLSTIILDRANIKSVEQRCNQIFNHLYTAATNISWIETRNKIPSLRTAYIALPTLVKNMVVMDATAWQSRAYKLLGSIPYYPAIPDDVRSYKNASLHVLYGYKNSKYALEQKTEQEFADVISSLRPAISKNKKFLFITFKNSEKKTSLKKHYPNCTVDHWGNINGKNTYKDFDTIILYGLPRLNDITLESALLAFENWHDKTANKYSAPYGYVEFDGYQHTLSDIEEFVTEEEYHQGFVTAEIIQAINRICCRQVIDEDGNCPPANVYLLFNKGGNMERVVLEGIRQEMNGINIIEQEPQWGEPQKLEKISKTGLKIIAHFEGLGAGEYPRTQIEANCQIPPGTMENYIREYKKADTPFSKSMHAIGVTKYISERGKYANSRFVKSR